MRNTGLFSLSILLLLYFGSLQARSLMDPISDQPEATSFSLEAVDGRTVSLADYQGKFVLLNFWATWCAPCRKEMPALHNLHSQLSAQGLEVVGVHVGPSLAGVKEFLEAVPVDFTILLDEDMRLTNWGVRGLPTTFLINPAGELVYKVAGGRAWDSSEMLRFLKKLMAQDARMASGESTVPAASVKKQSFFASLKERIGWNCKTDATDSKIFGN